MPDYTKCLNLGDFSAEDRAELQGFITSAGSDAAGVEAYLASLNAEMDGLKAEVAAKLGVVPEKVAPFEFGAVKTESATFKKWFGDSKVVDAAGKPKIVYHGSIAKIGENFAFSSGEIGKANDPGFFGHGFYFTEDKRIAEQYAFSRGKERPENLVSAYVSMQNPFIYNENDKAAIDRTNSRLRAAGIDVEAMVGGVGDKNAKAFTDQLQAAGFDGVIVSWDDAGTYINQAVAFSPAQIKSVNNRGTFDGADARILYQAKRTPVTSLTGESPVEINLEQKPEKNKGDLTKYQFNRGSVQFPNGGLATGKTVINLFEEANLSTFLHEFSHYALEVFTTLTSGETAPQSMRDDMAAIHKYLGSTEGQPFTTEQHEKWATTSEAYFMEGKSPSLELADSFSRFKAWLTRIYQTMKSAKISPEIRGVLDRMVATDAQIAAARDAQGMKPLFTSETAAGMSPGAFQVYQRMARRSAEQAGDDLRNKTMAKVRRETEAGWKEEYAAVKKEVTGNINSQKSYRLTEALANKRWLGDDARDVPDMQIDRKELTDAFGLGVLAELGRDRLGGKRAIYADNGASLREVADFFGYKDPSEMVASLQNAGKRVDAIKAETDRVMNERHGDPLNDGTIEMLALEAIHSDQQAKTVASEVRHLAGRAGLSARNLTAAVFRQRARAMLGRMSVGEAAKPNAFLAASRKAADRAEQAFAKVVSGRDAEGALVAATRFKEQQLLNHYLFLESRDLEKVVNTRREKMRDYGKKSVRAKLAGGYIEQIDALLDQYDFRVRGAWQIKWNENLKAFVDRMIADGREGELAIDDRIMAQIKKVHYSRLSMDELYGLFDTIDNIDHMGRGAKELRDAARKRDLDKVVGDVTAAIADTAGTDKAGKKSVVRSTINLLFTIDTMAVEYDGFEEMGKFYDAIKRDIDAGASLEQSMQMALAGQLDDLFKPYSRAEIADMKVARDVSGSNGRLWTKWEIISVALNMGSASNRQRMFDPRVHEKNRLTEGQAAALVAAMDRRDWDFAQSMIDLINSYWPQVSEVTERRTGTKPKKVDATPIETPFGTYPGGYYPIAYDPSLPSDNLAALTDKSSVWDKMLLPARRAEVESGMTKSRENSGGGRTLMFDPHVAFAHMKDTVRLIALSEAVDNAGRVLNDGRVKSAFQNAGRETDLRVLRLWLKDVASGPIMNSDGFNTFLRTVKNNFTLSRLAFNVKTVVLQTTGIAQSAATIGKMNMARGLQLYLESPIRMRDEVIAKSPMMALRRTTFDKDIYDFQNDVKLSTPLASGLSKAKQGIGKYGFAMMTYTQFYAVDMPTWVGAYHSELERSGDDAKAVHYADRMVARSQDSGMFQDRTAISRGTLSEGSRQSDFIKIWTTLGGYMITKMNRGYIEARRGVKGISEAETAASKAAIAANMATNLMLLYVVEGALMSLLYGMVYDDEAEKEEYAAFVAKETAMTVVGGVPFVREAAGAFQQGRDAGGVIGTTLAQPAKAFQQMMQGEADPAARRAVADLVGTITGLPTTATMRAIEELLDEETPSLAEAILGKNPIGR